jgi:hypothetical protein
MHGRVARDGWMDGDPIPARPPAHARHDKTRDPSPCAPPAPRMHLDMTMMTHHVASPSSSPYPASSRASYSTRTTLARTGTYMSGTSGERGQPSAPFASRSMTHEHAWNWHVTETIMCLSENAFYRNKMENQVLWKQKY